MNRHAIDLVVVHERASATPDGPDAADACGQRPPGLGGPLGPKPTTLREEQIWFAKAMTTPESDTALTDEDARRTLTAGPRSSALERFEIYRRGYHARLVECLADDYPAVQNALGHGPFATLCRAYIDEHPSTGPSLNDFGRHMPAFCRSRGQAFAADLADLEWAIVEVIHAPSASPLTLEGLRDVAPDAWATARLVPNTAFRLLRFEHPVNAYFQAFRAGDEPPVPAAEASATAVYRNGPRLWRMDLTVPMFRVLSALASGANLSDALSQESDADAVALWFREWVASGLFVGVDAG